MQTIDLTPKAVVALERAEALGVEEWRIRYRESGAPGTSGKETVETDLSSDDPHVLVEQWTHTLQNRASQGDARFCHIECIAKGQTSPFFSFAVELRQEADVIDPSEGGAWSALAQMGLRSNRLLYDLVLSFSARLVESQQAELRQAVVLAEAMGAASAGDDSARWEAVSRAAEQFTPAAQAAAEAFAQSQRARVDEARAEAARAEQAAAEARRAAAEAVERAAEREKAQGEG